MRCSTTSRGRRKGRRPWSVGMLSSPDRQFGQRGGTSLQRDGKIARRGPRNGQTATDRCSHRQEIKGRVDALGGNQSLPVVAQDAEPFVLPDTAYDEVLALVRHAGDLQFEIELVGPEPRCRAVRGGRSAQRGA